MSPRQLMADPCGVPQDLHMEKVERQKLESTIVIILWLSVCMVLSMGAHVWGPEEPSKLRDHR